MTDFNNPGRGYAFLTFSTREEAEACIAGMDKTEVAGRTIKMNMCRWSKGEEKVSEEGRRIFIQNVFEVTR